MLEYEIIRSQRRSIAIEIKRDGKVIVRAPARMSMRDIEGFVLSKRTWIEKHQKTAEQLSAALPFESYTEKQISELKASARAIILPMLEYYAGVIGVRYGSVKINRAKGRFGSCSSKNDLNFSCFLMLYPKEAIEYVVVHELCHIIEHNHSARFYANIERILPDYKQREKMLRQTR